MFRRFLLPLEALLILLVLFPLVRFTAGRAQAASQRTGAVTPSCAAALPQHGETALDGVAPTFRVTPGAVQLTLPLGCALAPQTLQVSNTGSAQLNWRLIAPSLTWLQITPQPAAGVIARGGPAEGVTLRFRNLTVGRTYATVLVFLDVNRHLSVRVTVRAQMLQGQLLQPLHITEFPLPTGAIVPGGITAGPDGNLWFTEGAGGIGRITPAGTITEFPTHNNLLSITTGPDGNLWFTDEVVNKIGRITPTGTITEFPIPTANSLPVYIAAGPDGNLWFTEQDANQIGRITPTGTITEFPVLTAKSSLGGITAGPDGNLWFTEANANQIGQITPAGAVTEFPVLTAGSAPSFITAGPDGNLWFTEAAGRIGRITPTGTVTEFPVPTFNSDPGGITAGPDGNLWFIEEIGNQIGRITPTGTVTEFPVPTAASGPFQITGGPDGNLWFTESSANQIGRLAIVKNHCPPLCL